MEEWLHKKWNRKLKRNLFKEKTKARFIAVLRVEVCLGTVSKRQGFLFRVAERYIDIYAHVLSARH